MHGTNPAAARTSEKSRKRRKSPAISLRSPSRCRTDRLAGCRRPSRRQATGSACAADLAVGYGLKYAIGKSRPAGHEGPAFPSIHSAVAFAGASYIQRRYGWKFGAPAYALAVYVGWSRIGARLRENTTFGTCSPEPGFGSGLRLPVYEALPQTENIVRRRSDRFGRRMRRSPRRPRVLNHPSANGQIGHVRRRHSASVLLSSLVRNGQAVPPSIREHQSEETGGHGRQGINRM